MTPTLKVLILVAAFYLTVPVGDVPGLGVSLSAPLFAWAAVEAAVSPRVRINGRWLNWATLTWFGCLLSLAANVVLGRLPGVEADEALLLLRFAYWLTVFVVVAAVVAQAEWADQAAAALGAGAAALSLLRLVEGVVAGVWGGGNPRWLSQNDYGFGFSCFLPFLLWLAVSRRGLTRVGAAAATAASWVALAGNGSRSSWVAALAAAVVFAGVLAAAGRLRFGFAGTAAVVAVAVALIVAAVPSVAESPLRRLDTLSALNRDKPFQTRLLLVEKGWKLFVRSPVFGVGLGRFSKEAAEVEGLRDAAWLEPGELDRRTPHNAYVKALAETGLVGVAPLAALLISLAALGLPAAVRLTRQGKSWAAAAVAAGAGMSLHLWTMSALTGAGPWFLLGLIAAVVERDRAERAACA